MLETVIMHSAFDKNLIPIDFENIKTLDELERWYYKEHGKSIFYAYQLKPGEELKAMFHGSTIEYNGDVITKFTRYDDETHTEIFSFSFSYSH